MSWAWLDLVDARPSHAALAAPAWVSEDIPAGWLAAWTHQARPTPTARRVYDAILDGEGAAAWLSLVRPPTGLQLPFDDLAVQQARRAIMSAPPWDAVSTLLTDASHFEGSIVIARGPCAQRRLAADPFARIFPARLLHVEGGILGRVPPPAGPTLERYGSAEPWPSDHFPALVGGTGFEPV